MAAQVRGNAPISAPACAPPPVVGRPRPDRAATQTPPAGTHPGTVTPRRTRLIAADLIRWKHEREPSMSGPTRHRGRWTQDDRCRSPWQYLPVEVPPGSAGLRVELDYDQSGAILDLGCFGPAGFRGWSGGARSSFVITPGEATPGYLPGELEPGRWHVVDRPVPASARRRGVLGDGFGEQHARPAAPGPGRRRPGPAHRAAAAARTARPGPGTAGWPVTCTPIPCTPTGS